MTPKEAVAQARADNARGYDSRRTAQSLMRGLCRSIDQIIQGLWQQAGLAGADLLAVGGYGRGELSPYSDIDLLILVDDGLSDRDLSEPLTTFVNSLWDAGLDAGHSVRTLGECMVQARDDLTVATALLEARLLVGRPERLKALQTAWHQTIDQVAFAQGKLLERRNVITDTKTRPTPSSPTSKRAPVAFVTSRSSTGSAQPFTSVPPGSPWSRKTCSPSRRPRPSRLNNKFCRPSGPSCTWRLAAVRIAWSSTFRMLLQSAWALSPVTTVEPASGSCNAITVQPRSSGRSVPFCWPT